MEALKAKPHPGRPPKLSEQQKQELAAILRQGAIAAGFPTDLWTLKRVAAVIERHFGVKYHPSHVWRVVGSTGWSAQKPERRARERDEENMALGQKKARQEGRSIVLMGESGFMLQPVVRRRTWAPPRRNPPFSIVGTGMTGFR